MVKNQGFIAEQKESMEEQNEMHSTAPTEATVGVPIKRADKASMDAWKEEKAHLLERDEFFGHAFGQNLKEKEKVVEKKLDKLRQAMLDEDPVLCTSPHYAKLDKIQNSALHEAFRKMPKPAVHHTHFTGAIPASLLLELTYYAYVYYSEKEEKFHVNQNGCNKPGYMLVNSLRQYS